MSSSNLMEQDADKLPGKEEPAAVPNNNPIVAQDTRNGTIESNSNSNSSNSSNTNNNNNTDPQPKKNKRPICSRCHRPTPLACICEGLPDKPIALNKCHVLVLQHPHEERRKNRSLPLVQLCLTPESMTVVVGRRFGDQDPRATALLQQSDKVLLIFPEKEVLDDDSNHNHAITRKSFPPKEPLSLSEARDYCQRATESSQEDDSMEEQPQQESSTNSTTNSTTAVSKHTNNATTNVTVETVNEHTNNATTNATAAVNKDTNISTTNATIAVNGSSSSQKTIVVVMLDATWKYAKEMDKINTALGLYPPHIRRVALSWDDPWRPAEAVVPCRFDIRTPPSDVHLSTAECVAWVVSALEKQEDESSRSSSTTKTLEESPLSIYATLMKPLDVMVRKWHDCRRNKVDNHSDNHGHRKRKSKGTKKERNHTSRDDNGEATRNYDYYSNPDRATSTQETEEEATVSRASFFTSGDNERQQKKGRKRGR